MTMHNADTSAVSIILVAQRYLAAKDRLRAFHVGGGLPSEQFWQMYYAAKDEWNDVLKRVGEALENDGSGAA